MKRPLTAAEHLDRAIRDITYIRRDLTANEDLISADEAIQHIRKALELMGTSLTPVARPARTRERVSRFSVGRQ